MKVLFTRNVTVRPVTVPVEKIMWVLWQLVDVFTLLSETYHETGLIIATPTLPAIINTMTGTLTVKDTVTLHVNRR